MCTILIIVSFVCESGDAGIQIMPRAEIIGNPVVSEIGRRVSVRCTLDHDFIDPETGSFVFLEPRRKRRSWCRQFQAPKVSFGSNQLFDCDPLNTRSQLVGADLLRPYNAELGFTMPMLQGNDFTGLERYTESPQPCADGTDVNCVREDSFAGMVFRGL